MYKLAIILTLFLSQAAVAQPRPSNTPETRQLKEWNDKGINTLLEQKGIEVEYLCTKNFVYVRYNRGKWTKVGQDSGVYCR
jgi:hypothetical protein